ncbi:MAG: arsenosugar biosynthesis radical SAM (seleno)protein ArsS [Balneolales bacterium]
MSDNQKERNSRVRKPDNETYNEDSKPFNMDTGIQNPYTVIGDFHPELELLRNRTETLRQLPSFNSKLDESGLHPLTPVELEILQVNVGYICNMTCKHCHVDAGPHRKEIMSREILKYCLDAVDTGAFQTVDITGGAPEMNPDFYWFVDELYKKGCRVIVRSNLTILVTTPAYRRLPVFFAERGVEVTCSLPFYNKVTTDRQRGNGTYDKSVEALHILNELGYGDPGSGLELNLVYNPAGAFLPLSQQQLEADFKKQLWKKHHIQFNNLYTITNLPISRYLDFLLRSDNLDDYMTTLANAYNPIAAEQVMCRNTLSVGWDGTLYDCDFNQMLTMPVDTESCNHIREFDYRMLMNRRIRTGQHCFGCTAGAGSSCGGSLDNA